MPTDGRQKGEETEKRRERERWQRKLLERSYESAIIIFRVIYLSAIISYFTQGKSWGREGQEQPEEGRGERTHRGVCEAKLEPGFASVE